MSNSIIKNSLLLLLSLAVIVISFLSGFFTARVTSSSFSLNGITQEIDANHKASFSPLFEAWDLIHDEYLQQPVDDQKLLQGAIRGMVDALGDPFSAYMDPDEYREQNMPLEGEYTGIGAWVDVSGEWLVVISPMPGSPAEKAGLKPNDIIFAVDGQDMTGVDPSLVQKKLLGPDGTRITLSIKRENQEIFEVNLLRAVIKVPSIVYEILPDSIGYIHLMQFSLNSDKEMRATLEKLISEKIKGIILDLRNNSGGYVHVAVNITSEFITRGPVLIEEYGDGHREEYDLLPGGIAVDIPLVVLVNEGSASAAEILAGALQDYERAKLVGSVTFGKGLIQAWPELTGDNGAIRLSIARWLTPLGRQIHLNGLTPDFPVSLTDDDVNNNKDTQLMKAIEIIKNDYTFEGK